MANTLFLRLEGPLQAWGERARWCVRDTAPQPTKSGLVGLLACALGWNSDEELRGLSRQVRLGVRCDRPGLPLVDYHTVAGGRQSAEDQVSVVAQCTYLCDASFLAAIQASDPGLIARLAEAVQAPRWPIYLGRRSCPPSRALFAGTGDYVSLHEALEAQPMLSAAPNGPVRVRAVLECAPGRGIRVRDEIDARSRRTFLPRYTQDVMLTVRVQQEE
jgi:CRISPR system Cascade subunit CasD